MKIDGREIARALARQRENMELVKEGHASNREQEAEGSHIKAMASFIEAIHHKEPEKAHEHFNAYRKAMEEKDEKKEVE